MFPPPGCLPDPVIKPPSPASPASVGGFFTTTPFMRALTPFTRAPPSWPNHFPKALHPDIISRQGVGRVGSSVLGFQHVNFEETQALSLRHSDFSFVKWTLSRPEKAPGSILCSGIAAGIGAGTLILRRSVESASSVKAKWGGSLCIGECAPRHAYVCLQEYICIYVCTEGRASVSWRQIRSLAACFLGLPSVIWEVTNTPSGIHEPLESRELVRNAESQSQVLPKTTECQFANFPAASQAHSSWRSSEALRSSLNSKQTSWGKLVIWLSELKPGLCNNLEALYGVGQRFKKEGHKYTHGWLILMYGRNQAILEGNYPSIKNQ